MFKPDKRLKNFYDKANRLYFSNELPNDTQLGWNEEIPGYGLTISVEDEDTKHTFFTIYIDRWKHFDQRQIYISVIHEMAHVRLYPYMKHGKRFKDEMRRLAIVGAFDELW